MTAASTLGRGHLRTVRAGALSIHPPQRVGTEAGGAPTRARHTRRWTSITGHRQRPEPVPLPAGPETHQGCRWPPCAPGGTSSGQ